MTDFSWWQNKHLNVVAGASAEEDKRDSLYSHNGSFCFLTMGFLDDFRFPIVAVGYEPMLEMKESMGKDVFVNDQVSLL